MKLGLSMVNQSFLSSKKVSDKLIRVELKKWFNDKNDEEKTIENFNGGVWVSGANIYAKSKPCNGDNMSANQGFYNFVGKDKNLNTYPFVNDGNKNENVHMVYGRSNGILNMWSNTLSKILDATVNSLE